MINKNGYADQMVNDFKWYNLVKKKMNNTGNIFFNIHL